MSIRRKQLNTIIQLAILCCLLACNKKEFLDKNPSSELLIPTTLDDFQALLDNFEVMGETPALGELSADNYHLPQTFWINLNKIEHNAYVWDKNIYPSLDHGSVGDWDKPYQQIFYANVVLEGIEKNSFPDSAALRRDQIKGAAYFIRGYAYHNLAQIFSPPFENSAGLDEKRTGIPLRNGPSINDPIERSTLQQTYTQIIQDINNAIRLLPEEVPSIQKNRPSKPAAYALMARVYLSMQLYPQALLYADSCLMMYDMLIDYNEISTGSTFPFRRKTEEVLYQSNLLSTTSVLKTVVVPSLFVDSFLYQSYEANDLRRNLFYANAGGGFNPRPGYSNSIFMFSGLATDEVYLIKAECLARTENYNEAMDILNVLLERRYLDGSFVPIIASDQENALEIILLERRKELPFRGVRWSDLRRLNKEGRMITLKRVLDQEYILPPNHNNYVLPIPPDARNGTNMQNNPRD